MARTPYTPSNTEKALADLAGAFVALDAGWRVTYINPTAQELVHVVASDVLEGSASEVFPALTGSGVQRACEAARATGAGQCVEGYAPRIDRWFIAR